MYPPTSLLHRHGWRVLLLLLLALGVWSARYSLICLFTHCYAGAVSPDGNRIVLYDYMYLMDGHSVRPRIADVKTFETRKDISGFQSGIPRWTWAPDSQSILGAVRIDEENSALMQIDVSGTPKVIRREPMSESIKFCLLYTSDAADE